MSDMIVQVQPKRKRGPLFWIAVVILALLFIGWLANATTNGGRNGQIEQLCSTHNAGDPINYAECKHELSSPSLAPYLDQARK